MTGTMTHVDYNNEEEDARTTRGDTTLGQPGS